MISLILCLPPRLQAPVALLTGVALGLLLLPLGDLLARIGQAL